MVPVIAFLFLSTSSLLAQTTPNCDVSKCSPKEREACAKTCNTALNSLSSFLNLALETTSATANCKPASCKEATANATLVSTEIVPAPTYAKNLPAKEKNVSTTEKAKNCSVSCCKTKASL